MPGFTECLIFFFMITMIYAFLKSKPKNYPPGPYGIPLLGYMPFTDPVWPHKTIVKLSKKYGDVFSLTIGNRDAVYLNSYNVAKEAFNNPHIQGRPDFATFKFTESTFLTGHPKDAELHHRFILRHLKDFGFGKASLEPVIAREAEKLVERFRETGGKPFQVSNNLNIAIVNVIWHMTASLHLSDTDQFYHMLLNHLRKSAKVFSSTFLADFLTWGSYVFPNWLTKMDHVKRLSDIMDTMNQKLIDEHEETLDSSRPRDLTDAYLIRMKEDQEKGVKNTTFTYGVLRGNMTGLFIAGSDTVATTIKDALLLLTQHPEIQEKIKHEIQSVTEGKRRVSLEDKYKLPYFEAFIMEVQRYSSILPFGLAHFTTENTTIGKYQVPKNTLVMVNMFSIHFEEKYWEDPLKFDPKRFLNEDGSVNYKKEGFMPFSIGKRMCLGSQLAKAELLMFLGYLLQDFTFSTPVDTPPVSVLDATGGLVIQTPPYDLIAA